jgi:hypothetical protein
MARGDLNFIFYHGDYKGMNTHPELIDQASEAVRAAKKAWVEPQIMVERPLEARADDLPRLFPTPTGRMGPLGTSGGPGGCL